MRQMTLAHQAGFQGYSKKTRREQFLEEMEAVMPWAELIALIEPHFPKGEISRRRVGLASMLRDYFSTSGSCYRTRVWKMHCTSRRCCAALQESILVARGFRM